MNSVQQSVLERIKAGKVIPKPRWRFRLEAALFSVVAVIVGVGAIYLFSLIVFQLHISGLMLVPAFGIDGLWFFVVASPWILIGLSIAFLVLLAVLVQHYSFNYRRPFVTVIAAVVLFVVTSSMLLHAISIHEKVRVLAERYRVPGIVPFYNDAFTQRYPEVVIGEVMDRSATHLLVRDRQGGMHMVRIKPDAFLGDGIDTGDYVVVFGKSSGSSEEEIDAVGIRSIKGERFGISVSTSTSCAPACPVW